MNYPQFDFFTWASLFVVAVSLFFWMGIEKFLQYRAKQKIKQAYKDDSIENDALMKLDMSKQTKLKKYDPWKVFLDQIKTPIPEHNMKNYEAFLSKLTVELPAKDMLKMLQKTGIIYKNGRLTPKYKVKK
jgi:hypothetical protein